MAVTVTLAPFLAGVTEQDAYSLSKEGMRGGWGEGEAENPLLPYLNSSSNGSMTPRTPASMRALLEQEPAYRAAYAMIVWLLPVVVALGTFGNLLSLAVMRQREIRQTSTYFYLAALALADTAVLYFSALKTWVRTLFGFELLHVSNVGCKAVMYLVYLSTHVSAWIIVAVTIERFLAVWFPLKANTMCSLSRAKVGTFTILGIFLVFDSHVFWTAELREIPNTMNPDGLMCVGYAYENFVCKILPWVNMVLYSFLPFLVLLKFNVLIIVSLRKHRQVLTTVMTKDEQQVRANHRKLAVTLVTISCVWIVTTLPMTVYTLVNSKAMTLQDAAQQVLAKICVLFLVYINHSVNFFLYCVTGKRFRHEMMRMLCRRKRRQPRTKMVFKTSGSGPDSSSPLVENVLLETHPNARDRISWYKDSSK